MSKATQHKGRMLECPSSSVSDHLSLAWAYACVCGCICRPTYFGEEIPMVLGEIMLLNNYSVLRMFPDYSSPSPLATAGRDRVTSGRSNTVINQDTVYVSRVKSYPSHIYKHSPNTDVLTSTETS